MYNQLNVFHSNFDNSRFLGYRHMLSFLRILGSLATVCLCYTLFFLYTIIGVRYTGVACHILPRSVLWNKYWKYSGPRVGANDITSDKNQWCCHIDMAKHLTFFTASICFVGIKRCGNDGYFVAVRCTTYWRCIGWVIKSCRLVKLCKHQQWEYLPSDMNSLQILDRGPLPLCWLQGE